MAGDSIIELQKVMKIEVHEFHVFWACDLDKQRLEERLRNIKR
jgi:hypothetical protein